MTDELFQVEDSTFHKRVGRSENWKGQWHLASPTSGIICDVVRSRRAKVKRWRVGTEKVDCTACQAIVESRSNQHRSVYELISA
jgi:hypothetical protein